MIIIAHRGLFEGPNKEIENSPIQIEKAIDEKFNVEVDIRYIDHEFYLGHDIPQYSVDIEWLISLIPYAWFHCKNVEALLRLKKSKYDFHYFWHEEDTLTLTSKGFIWAYPGKQPIRKSIGVMPELYNDDVSECFGICTDYAHAYRDRLKL